VLIFMHKLTHLWRLCIAITVLFAITRMYICLLHCRVRLLQVRLSLWLSTMPRKRGGGVASCPVRFTLGQSRWYTSSRRLCGFRSPSGRLAEEKHLHLCRESSHGLSVAQSLCRYVYQVQSLQLCWRSFIEQMPVYLCMSD
jgi:hypothetical protein